MERDDRDYLHSQAAYWEIVHEEADGLAKEQAANRRKYYLYLLGMLAVKDGDEAES